MFTIKKVDNKVIAKRVAIVFSFTILAAGLLYIGNGPGAVPLANAVSTSPQTQSFSVTLGVLSEITVTAPSAVVMANAIYGITGNLGSPASGSTSFTVKTNNATGFNMTVKASTTPALATGSYYFSDYTPVAGKNATPDAYWQSPLAASASFGFAVGASGTNGADAAQTFKVNALDICNGTFMNSVNYCWLNLNGTTPITAVNRTTNTGTSGVTETLAFRAESNAAFLVQDTYAATITVTVATN